MSELADHMWAVLEVVAKECAVPGVKAICTLAHHIHKQGQEIEDHKNEISLMTGRVYNAMLVILARQDTRPEQASIDKLLQVVERFHEDVNTWSQFRWYHWRQKSHTVKQALDKYRGEFQAAIDNFHLAIDLDTNAALTKARQRDEERWKEQQKWHEVTDEKITAMQTKLECAQETWQVVLSAVKDRKNEPLSDNTTLLAEKWAKDDVWNPEQIKRLEVHIFQGEDLGPSFPGRYTVHRGSFKKGPRFTLVIKELNMQRASEQVVNRVVRQANALSKLRHSNIVTFLGTTAEDQKLTLITKYCSNGNVEAYLTRVPTANRLQIALDVIKGIRYLHAHGYIHLNIKPSNILISKNGMAQIDSFDYAKEIGPDVESSATISHNTLRWKAPESITRHGKVDVATDIYGWAMTALFMLTEHKPFKDIKDEEMTLDDVKNGPPAFKDEYWPRTVVENIANGSGAAIKDVETLWELLVECWSVKKEDRPSAGDIVACLLSMRNISHE